MSTDNTYPRPVIMTAMECSRLGIPLWWKRKPMTRLRIKTIRMNL